MSNQNENVVEPNHPVKKEEMNVKSDKESVVLKGSQSGSSLTGTNDPTSSLQQTLTIAPMSFVPDAVMESYHEESKLIAASFAKPMENASVPTGPGSKQEEEQVVSQKDSVSTGKLNMSMWPMDAQPTFSSPALEAASGQILNLSSASNVSAPVIVPQPNLVQSIVAANVEKMDKLLGQQKANVPPPPLVVAPAQSAVPTRKDENSASRKPFEGRCGKCGQVGHKQVQCRQNKFTSNKNTMAAAFGDLQAREKANRDVVQELASELKEAKQEGKSSEQPVLQRVEKDKLSPEAAQIKQLKEEADLTDSLLKRNRDVIELGRVQDGFIPRPREVNERTWLPGVVWDFSNFFSIVTLLTCILIYGYVYRVFGIGAMYYREIDASCSAQIEQLNCEGFGWLSFFGYYGEKYYEPSNHVKYKFIIEDRTSWEYWAVGARANFSMPLLHVSCATDAPIWFKCQRIIGHNLKGEPVYHEQEEIYRMYYQKVLDLRWMDKYYLFALLLLISTFVILTPVHYTERSIGPGRTETADMRADKNKVKTLKHADPLNIEVIVGSLSVPLLNWIPSFARKLFTFNNYVCSNGVVSQELASQATGLPIDLQDLIAFKRIETFCSRNSEVNIDRYLSLQPWGQVRMFTAFYVWLKWKKEVSLFSRQDFLTPVLEGDDISLATVRPSSSSKILSSQSKTGVSE